MSFFPSVLAQEQFVAANSSGAPLREKMAITLNCWKCNSGTDSPHPAARVACDNESTSVSECRLSCPTSLLDRRGGWHREIRIFLFGAQLDQAPVPVSLRAGPCLACPPGVAPALSKRATGRTVHDGRGYDGPGGEQFAAQKEWPTRSRFGTQPQGARRGRRARLGPRSLHRSCLLRTRDDDLNRLPMSISPCCARKRACVDVRVFCVLFLPRLFPLSGRGLAETVCCDGGDNAASAARNLRELDLKPIMHRSLTRLLDANLAILAPRLRKLLLFRDDFQFGSREAAAFLRPASRAGRAQRRRASGRTGRQGRGAEEPSDATTRLRKCKRNAPQRDDALHRTATAPHTAAPSVTRSLHAVTPSASRGVFFLSRPSQVLRLLCAALLEGVWGGCGQDEPRARQLSGANRSEFCSVCTPQPGRRRLAPAVRLL